MSMYITSILLFTFLISGHDCGSELFRQEAAKVIYSNPKFIKEVSIITKRMRRTAPYLTYINLTTVETFSNNVTFVIEAENRKANVFKLDLLLCDLVKTSWCKEWLKEFSNAPTKCPYYPNTYYFSGIEVPPRNFPVPLAEDEYYMAVSVWLNDPKLKMIAVGINLKTNGKFGK